MLAAAFLMGLLGSMHCISMCGPLAVVANRMGQGQSAFNSIIYNGSRISVYILLGLLFGSLFGVYHWISSIQTSQPATAGTVLLSAVPIILGFQLLLQAVVLDIQNVPK